MLTLLIAALLMTGEPDRSADIAALTDAKLNLWPNFYRKNDADGLAAFLTDDFVAFSDDGSVETKQSAVDFARQGEWTVGDHNFRYEIKRIDFYAADVANVYGIGRYDGATERGPCRMAYTSTNIFVRHDGRWKPKFSHTSASQCEPAAKE